LRMFGFVNHVGYFLEILLKGEKGKKEKRKRRGGGEGGRERTACLPWPTYFQIVLASTLGEGREGGRRRGGTKRKLESREPHACHPVEAIASLFLSRLSGEEERGEGEKKGEEPNPSTFRV